MKVNKVRLSVSVIITSLALSSASQAFAQSSSIKQPGYFQAAQELFWFRLLNKDIQVKDVESFGEMKEHFEAHEKEIDERFISKTYYDDNDKISCIDMYHQPGLSSNNGVPNLLRSEPLLATPPSTPTTEPSARISNMSRGDNFSGFKTTFEIHVPPRCPEGEVPLIRLKLADIARFKTLDDYFSKSPISTQISADGRSVTSRAIPPVHEYATVRKTGSNWGASAFLSLNQPFVESKTDFSLSQIWVSGGSSITGTLQTVEAGIQAYPTKYGNSVPRLFTYFTPDNYGVKKSCYNMDCKARGLPGYLQVDRSIIPGARLANYSVVGGAQYEIDLKIIRDSANGNWWLKVGDKWAGYWPAEIFNASGIGNQADTVTWGGEIYDSNPTRHTTTEMGSGRFAREDFGRAAFQRDLQVLNTYNFYQRLSNPVISQKKPNCYSLTYFQDDGSSWGSYIHFGGKGYSSICP